MNQIKIIFILLISVSIILGITLCFNHIATQNTQAAHYRIALFEPAIHSAIDEISQGYIDTLTQQDVTYACTRYNANGNKIMMQSQAQEIIHQNYDLIFTIGASCSLMIKELCTKNHCTTPQVFSSVDTLSLLQPFGPTITGVQEVTNYNQQLTLLTLLKPSIHTILLVYDGAQGTGLEKDKKEIQSILQQHNKVLVAVEIQNPGEVQQKVSDFMDTVDAVMILKNHTAVSSVDSLVTLCNRYQIPLLASDLNSGKKGAALAYGIREYESGIQAARQTLLILEQNKKPADIPVTLINTFIMKINKTQAPLQGLIIDPTTLHQFSRIEME